MKETQYQLWLNDLGNDPDAVIRFLRDDVLFAGTLKDATDVPELPWMMLELPAGSDTFSLIHINADALAKQGANVSVRKLRPPYLNALFILFIVGLLIGAAFVFMVYSAGSELRDMHEHEVQEMLQRE